MATEGPISLRCQGCGAPMATALVDNVNVARQPELRQAILDGTFMRGSCPSCGEPYIIERRFVYADFEGGLFLGVFPRSERGERDACAAAVTEAFQTALAEAPAAIRADLASVQVRLCFGLAEVREKIVCAAAGLDDRVLAALQLVILEGIPGAAESGVRSLVLVAVAEESGALILAQEMDRPMAPTDPLIQVDRAVYDDLARDRERVATLLPPLFESAYVRIESQNPWPSPS